MSLDKLETFAAVYRKLRQRCCVCILLLRPRFCSQFFVFNGLHMMNAGENFVQVTFDAEFPLVTLEKLHWPGLSSLSM